MGFNTYDLGKKVRVYTGTNGFTVASSGAALDPDVVKLSILEPDETLTTYTYGVGSVIVKEATGKYYADIDVDQAGTWWARWFSTGDGQAADEIRFVVEEANAI